MIMMQEQQQMVEQLTNEALEGEKQLRIIDEGVRSSKRKMVDKTFRKLFFRKLALAMGRWKDICKFRGQQEDMTSLVIKRMRNRFLRQSFDLYLQFYKKSQQHGRNVKGADFMRETLAKRTLRKHFNAMCFHTNRQVKSRKYWLRILGKMDGYMKKRAIQILNDATHMVQDEMLLGNQDSVTNQIALADKELCRLEMERREQEAVLEAQRKLQKKKAYRQIGNYFMRNYSETTHRQFKIWKDYIHEQKHKEKILKKTFDHYRKIQFEKVRQVFISFMSDDRKREALEKIKQLEIEAAEQEQMIKHNQEQQGSLREKENIDMVSTGNVSNELKRRVIHVMNWMERTNQTKTFVSRKRMIFMCWRHAAKQQKAFLLCVENVLRKSLMNLGMRHIKDVARDVSSHSKVERALKRFRTRIFKTNAGDCFTKWKAAINTKVDENKNDVIGEMQAKNDEFLQHVDLIKETNNARCFKYF